MKSTLLFFLILLLNTSVFSQDFGEEYEKYLKLNTFEKAPDSDILIIFDKGNVEIDKDFRLFFKQHTRIKILTEKGKEYANIKIPYWHEDHIYGIDAAAYSTDGKVFEIESDNIFDEGTEKYKVKSLAIPGVEVGSVIEYKYTLESKYITSISAWYFQAKHYTLLSEYSIEVAPGFLFNKVETNIRTEYTPSSGKIFTSEDNIINQSKVYKWTCTNLPGIKDEPYVDNIRDQYAKIQIIFNTYKGKWNHITFAKTWKDIAERFYKGYDDFFNDEIDLPKDLEDIINGTSPTEKKVKEIYNYVSNKIDVGKYTGIYASRFKDLEDILSNKIGSAVEKNVLLINLYRRLGLTANPILISKRSNGEIITGFVDPAQFNRMICLLELNKKKYFLYAGKYNQFGYLIPSYNVEYGFKIYEDGGEIIRLSPKHFNSAISIKTNGELEDDGTLELVSEIIYKGYPAYYKRLDMDDEDLKKWTNSIVRKIDESAEVDTFYIENISINDPLKLTIHYNLSDFVEESDDLIYFTPPLIQSLKENVFIREKRFFPVEFNYIKNTYEKCKIKLPKGVSVTELPGKKSMKIKNYSYGKMYSNENNTVQIIMMRNRKARVIPSEEYRNLKGFFEKILEYDTEQLVFSKKKTVGH